MPLQNRVTPFGTFERSSARGSLMGNRGILHDDRKNVLTTHTRKGWVACALSFKGVTRQIMAPGHYTELFFLDEATALAAGHRPCALCRRAAYREFTSLWQELFGGVEQGRSLSQTIDDVLHAARITRQRRQVTHLAEASDLPDGTMISLDGQPQLLWQGRRYGWSFDGYRLLGPQPQGEVTVLTPTPLVAILRAGYRPEVHGSLESAG